MESGVGIRRFEFHPQSHKEPMKGFKQGNDVVRCASQLVSPEADPETGAG